MAESTTISNTANLVKYMDLEQGGKIMAEYVWIDADNEVRSKTTTVDKKVKSVADLKEWNFDGSSTNQATAEGPAGSDILLRPRAIYRDPFRRGDNIIVIADTYTPDGKPHATNYRAKAAELSEKFKGHHTWFGIEQEYTLLGDDGRPYGWPKGGFPGPQGPYYCGVGTGKVFCRDIVEAHYKACLYAGVNISGINAEVMPAQWEFQVGPCEGVEMGDDLWMARFLIVRIAEEFGVTISFHPKPLQGDWNGAGCHTNVSTKKMREDNGDKVILQAIEALSKKHKEHIAEYGEDNELRLTGKHETGNIEKFTYGVAQRGCSIRIPRSVDLEKKGYFEDRRPASNIDPYRVVAIMLDTVCSAVDG